MKLINFLLWLTAGAIFGWFASRMVDNQENRLQKADADFDDSD
jgi:hypothetical protein